MPGYLYNLRNVLRDFLKIRPGGLAFGARWATHQMFLRNMWGTRNEIRVAMGL